MKQETLEEAAERFLSKEDLDLSDWDKRHILKAMVNMTKWQQEQMYTEEEARTIWKAGQEYWKTSGTSITFEELIEQFKKK